MVKRGHIKTGTSGVQDTLQGRISRGPGEGGWLPTLMAGPSTTPKRWWRMRACSLKPGLWNESATRATPQGHVSSAAEFKGF